MKKIIFGIMKTGTLILFCLLALFVISTKASGGEPSLFGHQVKVVLSGSMDPTFKTGSIILTELVGSDTTYKNGDIITFQQEDRLVTHRIVDVMDVNGNQLFQTKGDNNNAADRDYVQAQHIVGKYTGVTIPILGYVVGFATSKLGAALLLFIPGLLLVLSAGRSIFLAARELEGKKVKETETV
ncbi:signal peptidase I SipW [Ornithinibacillus bavariensis]|uniref:signal peptidase I SipW n=1 Tax=Ornithinibacillus bavariensis TaxID=545502 RepID=UPI000ED00BC2|nr:signal peptidase I [Ornithinibacillus sp.]